MNKEYKVISSSPDSCSERFRGTKEECKQWIEDNKHRFPGYVILKIQPAEESARWERDFDIHSGGSIYEQMNRIDDNASLLQESMDTETFNKMKQWIRSSNPSEEKFYYSDFYTYVEEVYGDAISAVTTDHDVEFDFSTQGGHGGCFVYTADGTGSHYWDFDDDRACVFNMVKTSNTVEELKNALVNYLLDKIDKIDRT